MQCRWFTVLSKLCLLLAAGFVGVSRVAAGDYVWIEAESLAQPPAGFKVGGWGNKHYLSGESWLFAAIDGPDVDKLPADGLLLEYPFELGTAGPHEVWARLGYEFARSPFRWRLDEGNWADVAPEQLTTDLMELAEWTEVAWLKLGSAALQPGKHRLQVGFERRVLPGKKAPERILAGLDCFCISREPFRPNGRHKPEEKWQTASDLQAAQAHFDVPVDARSRLTVPLKGQWQIARLDEQEIQDRAQPLKTLPADYRALFWKSVRVPGNRDQARPDMLYCHRFLYRTKLDVPTALKGQTFVLRFPSTALIASVFVNGTYCGGSTTPCAAWEVDATKAIVPGQDNEVVVAIKDCYYAVAQTGEGKSARYLFNFPASWFYNKGGLNAQRFADFPVLFQVRGAGLFETPTLIVSGPAYVSDVFAKPSVARKELGLEITLRNSTAAPLQLTVRNEVSGLAKKTPEKVFAPCQVRLEPGRELTLELAEAWANPRLWWPDDPQLYQVHTRLELDGKVIDERATKFGFREWQWAGKHFTLNGIPWHFRADLLHNGKITDPDKVAADWKKSGINTVRYWGHQPWLGESQEETLDYYDRIGMPVRRTGIFDGQVASYQLVENKGGKTVPRRALFDNWIRQLRAWVKAERNHPSIFTWSIENEITYINTRNFGWLDACEPEIRRAVESVMQLDPTRAAMTDGGDALRDRSLPIYGNHYNEGPFRMYPDEAYTMKWAYNRHNTEKNRYPWPIAADRPLFLGETFFANGFPPAAYAAIQGEGAFAGRTGAIQGERLFARMLAEGYRWAGIAGFHFWMSGDGPDNDHYQAFQPICVLCREWNWTFAEGEVTRTLKVFNDTRHATAITVEWSLELHKPVDGGQKTFALKPGTSEEFTVTLRVPRLQRPERVEGRFVLRCKANDIPVYEDVKPVAQLSSSPFYVDPPPGADACYTLFDPSGVIKKYLQQTKTLFHEVKDLESIDKDFNPLTVLVIGPNALTARQATDPRWLAWAAAGMRILVVDQEHPVCYQALAADLEPTQYAGRIAFPENLEHPAFAGLGMEDFFTWPGGDHLVYRHAYKKASRGARSLLQCDEELSCTALAECPVERGLLMLAQVSTQGGFDKNPVVRRLFDNLLLYCLKYQPAAKLTVSVLANGDRRVKLLDAIGLKHRPATDLVAALADTKAEIVVADASPANLAALAAAKDQLQAFADRGGYLMLWGLTPEGLADYNKVVGVHHVLRPFGMERVRLPAKREPLLAGLTLRDVTLEGTEKIYPWAGDRYPAKDTFTYVVDLDDIAPFAKSDKYAHGWSQMTNGLTSADSWKFIFYHDLSKADPKPKWSATLPHEEEVTGFSIILNNHYHVITKLRLTFDAKDSVVLDLKPGPELRQDFDFKGYRCRRITLEPLEWTPDAKQPVIGIDNIWLRVRRREDYLKCVVPLLNIGALVKYRLGKGGIVLNQVNVLETEANPINGPKKQNIVATLLRNLGATFAAEKLLVAGANLTYQPVPLEEKCNQFLTADKGGLDLGHFPVGEQKLAGVSYLIRDFRTSPLPACIMLGGPGKKAGLPHAVEKIAVGQRADMLFFLHTFNKVWDVQLSGKNKTAPTVFRYVVRYADGQTAEVSVVLERGVGHWLAAQPSGLPQAAVAWAAPLPKDAAKQAVVYQMPWVNPRPDAMIADITVTNEAPADRSYGVPVVLGITAASAAK